MLRTYLTSHNISIYRLSHDSHIPYSTLNDLVNHKLAVEKLRSGQLRALADVLSMDMNTVYDMCAFQSVVTSEKYKIQAQISIEHKTYVLHGERDGRIFSSEILPVKQESTAYLSTLAEWKLDEILDGIVMEEACETIYSTKT